MPAMADSHWNQTGRTSKRIINTNNGLIKYNVLLESRTKTDIASILVLDSWLLILTLARNSLSFPIFVNRMKYLRWLLLPFSLLYGLVVIIRNWLYDGGLLKSRQFGIPVI